MPKRKQPKHLLFDADILLHRFSHANQSQYDWNNDGAFEVVADFEAASTEVVDFVDHVCGLNRCKNLTMVFSGSQNFRYGVLPTYKHNRKDLVKPLLFVAMKDFLCNNYHHTQRDNLEGDDLMALLSTEEPGKHIICSIDKDMKQIPGAHFNWFTNLHTKITEEEGDRWFYTQILTGDPGDGYSGIPGCGPKKAAKILDGVANEDTWPIIVAAYEAAGLTEDDALQQARVARILRFPEYNFTTGEVTLWNPTLSS